MPTSVAEVQLLLEALQSRPKVEPQQQDHDSPRKIVAQQLRPVTPRLRGWKKLVAEFWRRSAVVCLTEKLKKSPILAEEVVDL